MPDIQEVFRMATQKVRPDPGALERQHRDQRWHVAKKKIGVYALVAALVVAGVVIGIKNAAERREPVAPAPTATATPLPAGALEPGTYAIDAAGIGLKPGITISVPGGYWGSDGFILKGGADSAQLGFWIVGNVYADPCQWSGSLPKPKTGPGVGDLVAALANQPGRNATTPTDVTLDGYAGKQMELTAPLDFAGCDEGQFRSWVDNGGGERFHRPGDHDLLWILDVDGNRLVIDAVFSPRTSAQDRAELLQIVESVRIDPR